MVREIHPFGFHDDPNVNDVDFRPQRVIGDDAPKDLSAPESVTVLPSETGIPAPVPSTSPESADSTSTLPHSPSPVDSSSTSGESVTNADVEKALTPIPIKQAPASETVPVPKPTAAVPAAKKAAATRK